MPAPCTHRRLKFETQQLDRSSRADRAVARDHHIVVKPIAAAGGVGPEAVVKPIWWVILITSRIFAMAQSTCLRRWKRSHRCYKWFLTRLGE